MKVLVCGDRNWTDREAVFARLDGLNRIHDVELVIEGDATGADRMAGEWAVEREVPLSVWPAQWNRYGRGAGPRRNQQMLDQHPDAVLAFHHDLGESRGTADM